jgi:hypothetical protein
MMLGLLLARAGIETLVLEKHADFLRDFRGDTLHPSTLEVIAELGAIRRYAPQDRRWRPGLLCIGDAAHAMSPVGGVGINIAIQDAVAAGNFLGGGDFSPANLRRLQRRREWPARHPAAADPRPKPDHFAGPAEPGAARGAARPPPARAPCLAAAAAGAAHRHGVAPGTHCCVAAGIKMYYFTRIISSKR